MTLLFSLISFFFDFLYKTKISVYIHQSNLNYIPKKPVVMIAVNHVVGTLLLFQNLWSWPFITGGC